VPDTGREARLEGLAAAVEASVPHVRGRFLDHRVHPDRSQETGQLQRRRPAQVFAERFAREIRDGVHGGEGSSIPTQSTMVKKYGVPTMTVSGALALLAQAGMITEPKPGRTATITHSSTWRLGHGDQRARLRVDQRARLTQIGGIQQGCWSYRELTTPQSPERSSTADADVPMSWRSVVIRLELGFAGGRSETGGVHNEMSFDLRLLLEPLHDAALLSREVWSVRVGGAPAGDAGEPADPPTLGAR